MSQGKDLSVEDQDQFEDICSICEYKDGHCIECFGCHYLHADWCTLPQDRRWEHNSYYYSIKYDPRYPDRFITLRDEGPKMGVIDRHFYHYEKRTA